jgi:predicted lipoprotein with Yx(FWY)xxD motif
MTLARTLAAATLALALAPGAALAAAHGNELVHSRKFKGQVYMMQENHLSLYFYAGDEPGVSNCYDECAEKWPPVLLPAGTKLGENYTLIERRDGTFQAAYKGRPLYRYYKDSRPGDINGDGIGGVWSLARP